MAGIKDACSGRLIEGGPHQFFCEIRCRGDKTRAETRPGNARLANRAIQPPMLDPTSTSGPEVRLEIAASVSSLQDEIVPSAKAPPDSP